MISHEEFKNMPQGTVFWIADAKSIRKERFVGITATRLYNYSGSDHWVLSVKRGMCCHRTLEDAEVAALQLSRIMKEMEIEKLTEVIKNAAREITELSDSEATISDWTRLDRTNADGSFSKEMFEKNKE